MVIQRRTQADLEDAIADAASARDKTMDTRIGPIRDLYITPPAVVLKQVHDEVVYLSQLQSLKNAGRISADDLDDFVYNEGLVRWADAPALGVVTFARANPPSANIAVAANFPLSTSVDPSTGNVVYFRTTQSAIMYGPLVVPPSSYYNSETEKYEIDVAVASVNAGSAAEVGPYTIVQMRRSFSDFDDVYNKKKTTQGSALEANDDLAERYLMQVEGNQIATPRGQKVFCLDSFTGLEDAHVVYGNDPSLEREQSDAGAVDVWIKSTAEVTASYDTLYTGVGVLMSLPKQPVMEVSVVSSGATTFTEGVDYEVVRGEGIYAYSDRASDGIRFLATGSVPVMGGPVHVEYSYNSMIPVLSSFGGQPANHVLGADVLYRSAQPVYLEIEAELKVSSGNPTTVLQRVRAKVLEYINALRLDDNVEEFDIDRKVGEVYGVDNWVYLTLAIKGGTGVSDVEISPREYPYLLEADLVVNLVS